MYEPTWKQYEAGIREAQSPAEQLKSLEAFEETRTKEMAVSQKARDYEESRRKRVAKDKPQWIKQKRAEETAELDGFVKDLKKGGEIDAPITPMPGYILVKPEAVKEQTDSGLFIAMPEAIESNIGIVKACGGALFMEKNILVCPVKVGDRVFTKKFAGMDLLVEGENCKLMQFTDLLARIDD